MNRNEYDAFTHALVKNLSADKRVMGLIAVGSMAATHNQPDEWSDHDFLIITKPGVENEFRNSTEWFPKYRPIVLHFRETAHGTKVVYDDGHLLEFAVFNQDDFSIVKINSFRVLIDNGGIKELVNRVAAATTSGNERPTNEYLFGQFLTHLLVGVGRHARGEHLSGNQFVKQFAVQDLLALLTRYVPIEGDNVLDNIDRARRFERGYPRLGAELNAALALNTPKAALSMLAMTENELTKHQLVYNQSALKTVRSAIQQSITSN